MMMQVLFLSKGILTADDALTTNQKIERVQITCSYSPLNSTHTRILGALTNLMDLKMKKKKNVFAFALRVMKLPISTHANSHHSFEKATESTVCGPASFILL